MDHLIQHFRKDEQPFIEKVIGWQREVEDRFAPKLSDFLDPRERFIVTSILTQNNELKITTEGGFHEAERQRMLIYPNYYVPTYEDLQITVFSVNYPSKFVQLKHPDVLGSLLSIGLTRGKFGDIHIDGEKIQFSVAQEVEDYVKMNLNSIGKAKIQLEKLTDKSEIIQMSQEWVNKTYTVSSMRLDTVLASIFNISRQKSQSLIQADKVKVNWTLRDDTSFELHDGDIVSARGFGRVKIVMTEGRTKKDKIRLQIGRLEQK
ncbi:RNA-binding protein YlmH [Ureibacillus xyleni]|uniref:RNA-binding protein YlmH n=1 Tax=Ureibacillus xyleni TaxID=614648 RepID=A0A285RF26_9BACL|nr:YlmH/Sll1252 family protein [Ureibacillus xyleni]SOB92514.1 RNA-binding protein YlmH [Ureibacillus xyleni]